VTHSTLCFERYTPEPRAILRHAVPMQIGAVFDRCEALGVSMLNSAQFYGADRANEKIIGRFTGDRADKFQARHNPTASTETPSLACVMKASSNMHSVVDLAV
jgi:hypothetical protein